MSILICVLLSALTSASSLAADSGVIYLSPVDGSEWQSTESRLIIGFDGPVPEPLDIRVVGSISGVMNCQRYISSDGKRLVLTPEGEFAHGEMVEVDISWSSGSVRWSFTVRPVPHMEVTFPCLEENSVTVASSETGSYTGILPERHSDGVSTPLGFPELVLNVSGQPSDGNYFFGTLTPSDVTNDSYLIIADNGGEPLFYWHWIKGIFCVEVQPGGLLTFGTRLAGNVVNWLVMDDTYTFQDSFKVTGYSTDIHDMSMRENGNVLMIANDGRYMDMSLIVPGGNPNAYVVGLLIQEQDDNHMPIFQWSSFDHIDITDAAHFIDLTGTIVDYVHCNSINEDLDGNILISCLSLCECIKIDVTTGDIIWRFGGLDADTNRFVITGDPLGGFSSQHDFNVSGPGLYTVFDNGRFHNPQVSRGLEYDLDTTGMTATLIWSYQEAGLYGNHFGSTQRLPGDNYVIGWGNIPGVTTFSDATEVDPAGMEEHSMRFLNPIFDSYRAYKYDWEGQALVPYLVAETDTINSTAVLTYNVFGNDQFDLYRIWHGTSSSQLDPLFLTDEKQVSIWELPIGWNYFAVSALDSNQVETGLSNIDSVQVFWTGISSEDHPGTPGIDLFPNPASGIVNLVVNCACESSVEIGIFDMSGRIVRSARQIPVQAGGICREIAVDDLPSGLYTLRVWGEFQEFSRSLVILR